MINRVTRHLLVPGRGIPGPDHWQQRGAGTHEAGVARAFYPPDLAKVHSVASVEALQIGEDDVTAPLRLPQFGAKAMAADANRSCLRHIQVGPLGQ